MWYWIINCMWCWHMYLLFNAFSTYRYLKRGVNEKGRVANDVETEQIVFDDVPDGLPLQISSVVQNRGSIPLFWSQETSRLNLKPDIICMHLISNQILHVCACISQNIYVLMSIFLTDFCFFSSIKEGPELWSHQTSFWKPCQKIWEPHNYFESNQGNFVFFFFFWKEVNLFSDKFLVVQYLMICCS